MLDRSEDRAIMVGRLAQDLVGPHKENEELRPRPSDVYLTGILWPRETRMPEDDERLGTESGTVPENDSESEEVRGASQKPCVAGISFCAKSQDVPRVNILCGFATYKFDEQREVWVRQPHKILISSVDLTPGRTSRIALSKHGPAPDHVYLHIRSLELSHAVLVTVTLVNNAKVASERIAVESATLFQTSIQVEPCAGTHLIPKPPRFSAHRAQTQTSGDTDITDEESSMLLYRNVAEFAVGHVCSAEWDDEQEAGPTPQTQTAWVRSTWLPSVIVESVDPNGHPVFAKLADEAFDPLNAEALAFADEKTLIAGLERFCEAYSIWLQKQKGRLEDSADVKPELRHIAKAHLDQCGKALNRMRSAVRELAVNLRLRRAFQLANYAMHLQHAWSKTKGGGPSLRWRPFQLGFLLLSTPSAAIREHPDREFMDLLWFPTGGGKTEAYLALIACVAVYRRLSDNEQDHEGVCAFMRYTLRLLTTQQFARAAAMIVALEAIRTGRAPVPNGIPLRGNAPFSIGLWVGGEATPNTRETAFLSLHQNRSDVPSPKQLAFCPACGSRLSWSIESRTTPVKVRCLDTSCAMHGELPIYTVDEDIYVHRPTLLIGTVDKFAQIVRERRTNSLFAISTGSPPDLIIQDELHLISGPLGTIAGIYEAAFDLMFAKQGQKAKVIGSTATIRRATEQVRALFDREAFQFPPPAIDHNDSGFAVRDVRPNAKGRRYVGVTTAGRSAKFTLQAVAGSLLQSSFGAFKNDERRDSYWTLLGYFNSLRELGGALVLMHDDVADSIGLYADRRSETRRKLNFIEELTSRRTQEDIRDMLNMLTIPAGSPGTVDVVLATNMVSVGVDISRLGLMLVNGQPKTIAEYIQSTSRVGRGEVSGLVVSVLNNAKARDRSHFETFGSWHRTLYRDVEATSVTPFAPRARDKALHAALVATVRHIVPGMLDSPQLTENARQVALDLIDQLADRAQRIDPEETEVESELEECLERWETRHPERYWDDYSSSKSLLVSAELAAARQATGRTVGNAWPTLNSMRTVEAGTPFRLVSRLKSEGNPDEE